MKDWDRERARFVLEEFASFSLSARVQEVLEYRRSERERAKERYEELRADPILWAAELARKRKGYALPDYREKNRERMRLKRAASPAYRAKEAKREREKSVRLVPGTEETYGERRNRRRRKTP